MNNPALFAITTGGAILGIVTIFFPSLLNLEVSKVKRFEIEMTDGPAALKLEGFLGENLGKIVKLDVDVCAMVNRFSKCPEIKTDPYKSFSDKHALAVDFYLFAENIDDQIICTGNYDGSSYPDAIVFYFDKTPWSWEKTSNA